MPQGVEHPHPSGVNTWWNYLDLASMPHPEVYGRMTTERVIVQ